MPNHITRIPIPRTIKVPTQRFPHYLLKQNPKILPTIQVDMNPLEERVEELKDISKATHPDIPEWYIQIAVESYIKNNEPELMEYADPGFAEVAVVEDQKQEEEEEATLTAGNEVSLETKPEPVVEKNEVEDS